MSLRQAKSRSPSQSVLNQPAPSLAFTAYLMLRHRPGRHLRSAVGTWHISPNTSAVISRCIFISAKIDIFIYNKIKSVYMVYIVSIWHIWWYVICQLLICRNETSLISETAALKPLHIAAIECRLIAAAKILAWCKMNIYVHIVFQPPCCQLIIPNILKRKRKTFNLNIKNKTYKNNMFYFFIKYWKYILFYI